MSPGPGSMAVPKGKTRKQIKARKDRADAKGLKAFRDAVWHREEQVGASTSGQWAFCAHCGEWVGRGAFGATGEVHHRVGRRAKATRYDPDNGVLLCGALVNDCHGKAQRHEIEV